MTSKEFTVTGTRKVDFNASCPTTLPYSPTSACSKVIASHRAANVFASVSDVMRVWGEYYGRMTTPQPVSVRYPCTSCTSATGGGLSVRVPTTAYRYNHRVAHELGHTYQKRAVFGGGGVLSQSSWCSGHTWNNTRIDDGDKFDDVDPGPKGNRDGWSEGCAASEGWADFFAAATYFTKSAADPYFRFCKGLPGCVATGHPSLNPKRGLARMEGWTWRHSTNALGGMGSCVGVTPGVANVSTDSHRAHAMEGNSARFFWDLYDTTTVGDTNDNVSFSRGYLLRIWERFPDGWGHNKRYEPTNSDGDWDDPDGRNAVDYRQVECTRTQEGDMVRFSPVGHCQLSGAVTSNCLDDQDPQ